MNQIFIGIHKKHFLFKMTLCLMCFVGIFSACFLQGCSSLATFEKEDLPAYREISPFLFSGGYPSGDGFSELQSRGVQTFLDLEADSAYVSPQPLEGLTRGMVFLKLPLPSDEMPSDQQVRRFLGWVKDPARRPLYMASREGYDQALIWGAVYRVLEGDMAPRDAYEKAIQSGFWPASVQKELREYLRQLAQRKHAFFEEASSI